MFLVRDLVSPRTWLAMISHLAGLVIGFAVIFVFTFGLAFGFSLVVLALVGLPVLGVTLRFAEWFATTERARLGLMLGVRIPAWPAEARAGYRWGIVPRWRMFTERATWGEIGYGLLRLPVSAVAATVSVAAWAAGLVMLTLPLYNSLLPSGGAKIGDFVLGGTPRMTAVAVTGLVVLLAVDPAVAARLGDEDLFALAGPGAAALGDRSRSGAGPDADDRRHGARDCPSLVHVIPLRSCRTDRPLG